MFTKQRTRTVGERSLSPATMLLLLLLPVLLPLLQSLELSTDTTESPVRLFPNPKSAPSRPARIMFTKQRTRTVGERCLSPATMLLLLLLPVLLPLLQSLELTTDTTESPSPPKTLQKSITHCPSVGYFFERQDQPGHPGTCYLCYCKDDGLAGCTLRDSERCDGDDSYQRDVEIVLRSGQSRKRTRRNPGLMELFFNDPKKDIMMKSMVQANEEDCKPKDSKSIGCPPKDWCKGCLVCDCDDHKEWQCHVMSFCEDKTPRPAAKKIKKPETKEIISSENLVKPSPKKHKKNDKRSVNSKNKNPKKVSSTTTKKPAGPQISVKTLKKFIRKDQIKNGTANLLIIKKYISTMSPIESPELLKYKNDSRKLAQLLYQQYEASTKVTPAKREIKLEKIFYTKQKRNFGLKYNARGRKPMNINEHSDWNKKTKAKNSKRENIHNFYSRQNALMNPNEKNKIEIEEDEEKEDTKMKGNYKRKEKVIYIPKKRRNKRELPATTEVSSSSTIMENETVNISSVAGDQISEEPARILRNNEGIESNLTNYKYTIDDIIARTSSYDNWIVKNDSVNETTIKYAEIITIEDHDEENRTVANILNSSNIVAEPTTKQLNYDSQILDLNYTMSEITDSPVDQLKLINNQSLETSTIDFNLDVVSLSDKEFESKENRDMEITTINDFTATGWPTIEKQEINDSNNKTNNNTNGRDINTDYVTDINRIKTDLNTYRLEKNIQTNKTNFTGSPKHSSMNRTLKSFKTDFEKMLHSFSNNDTKPQQNSMLAIKYLKKLYSQLLSKKNNKTHLNNIAVMESICDTFGPCKISTNKVGLINYKITELIMEAKKALDIIKMIKGYLQLVDTKNNNTGDINEEAEFKRYIKQLNAIITDNYETPLTETEMTQMNYVKNKTKVFINSVGNFASILNDILKIIHSEKLKYDHIKKRRKLIINKVTRHKVDNSPLRKIKSLFLKFNLLQNTFMHNMYQAISELERKNNKIPVYVDKIKTGQSDKRYKTSVNKYMNKINFNLEKLKELALKMGAKQRRKREMRNDDAVEYLLTLMEYLLKQNNPVDTPPVADGIDLLIDAIRRAPDIKPMRKKFLNQMSFMSPMPYFKPISKSSSESEEDNIKSLKGNLKEDLSFEKPYSNDTLILTSLNDEHEKYGKPTSDAPHQSIAVTTTKYVDVEDLVFNGNVVQKVYMATIPAYESTDDAYAEKEEMKPLKPKKAASKIKESASGAEDDTVIVTARTDTETEAKSENSTSTSTTESTVKTQFDRLNEEYEKEMKGKAPSIKNIKIKRRKNKRLRKKQKEDTKSDSSSITKEVEGKKTRKKVVAEEATLRKHIIATEVDPFQSMDDESASRDIAALDAIDNEVFPSY